MNNKINSNEKKYYRQIKIQTYIIVVLAFICTLSMCVNVKTAAYVMEHIDNSAVRDEVLGVARVSTTPSPRIASTEVPLTEVIRSPLPSLVHEQDDSTVEQKTESKVSENNKTPSPTVKPKTVTNTPVVVKATETPVVKEEPTVKPKTVTNTPVVVKSTETPIVKEEPVVEETKPSNKFPENELMGNEPIDKEAFTKAVKDVAPNLVGTVDALLENYEKYGLKPSFPLAVACLESGYGKSGLAQNKNNLYGMGAYPANGKSAYQNAFTYTSKSESVLDFGKRISSKYIQQGLTTLEGINKKYCPPNQKWASHVRSIKNKIEEKYVAYTL